MNLCKLKKHDSFTITAEAYNAQKDVFMDESKFIRVNMDYESKPWYLFFKKRKLKNVTLMYIGE